MARTTRNKTMPLIAVRSLVVFPYMNLSFDVARPKSVAAVEQALDGDRLILLVSQRDENVENVGAEDLYPMGTVARIKQKIDLSDGGVRIHIEGCSRALLVGFSDDGSCLRANISQCRSVNDIDSVALEAAVRRLKALVDGFRIMGGHENAAVPPDSFFAQVFRQDVDSMLDALAGNILIRVEDKQEILETLSLDARARRLIELISTELKVLETEAMILDRVNEQMEQNNRDYFLREQVRAIKEELGEYEDSEADEYTEKINAADLPEQVKKAALAEARRMDRSSPTSPENTISRNYLDLILELPWNKYTEENNDIENARAVLNRDHYGLER